NVKEAESNHHKKYLFIIILLLLLVMIIIGIILYNNDVDDNTTSETIITPTVAENTEVLTTAVTDTVVPTVEQRSFDIWQAYGDGGGYNTAQVLLTGDYEANLETQSKLTISSADFTLSILTEPDAGAIFFEGVPTNNSLQLGYVGSGTVWRYTLPDEPNIWRYTSYDVTDNDGYLQYWTNIDQDTVLMIFCETSTEAGAQKCDSLLKENIVINALQN
ncbi:hypothetical protein KC909_03470, partial [Candidatus Dojkabacteria bacterium]|nr:hypothetical protein [Candidatus Dojkabacteria bacterium]